MSAFNLSTLAAMQEQRVEQNSTSVHFWRCQLTKENPRFSWNPDSDANDKPDGNEADKNEDNDDEADSDAGDFTRHLLHVTGCVLAPQAAGVHLVTVTTGSYRKQKQANGTEESPEKACPIVCIDPAAQRTLALGHEFVLETGTSTAPLQRQNPTASSCIFELAEGDGPMWLTGTHRVQRVVQLPAGGGDCEDDEEEEVEEEEEEELEDEEDEEAEEDIAEESEASEDDDEEELIEEVKPIARKKSAAATAAAGKGKRQVLTKKQKQQTEKEQQMQQRRKRTKPDS